MTEYHSCQLSTIDLFYKKSQEEQLNSRRFPVFPDDADILLTMAWYSRV